MSLCPQMKKPGSSHWWEQRLLTNNDEWEVFIDTDVSATTDSATMSIVRNFASGETVFFDKFVDAYLKVSELGHDGLLMAVGADATTSPTTKITVVPTIHQIPSSPTEAPESPSISPTLGPTVSVTHQPTKSPTKIPTITPASVPSKMPSTPPTSPPTSGPSKAPLKSDAYDVYENVGYCNSAIDRLISGPSTASECLEKCKETFSLWDSLFVEFFSGECFCQNSCPCLDDISSSGRTTMVPENFDLPASCDEDSTSSPTPGPDSKYWAVCGRRGRCKNEADYAASVADLHEVRCCSDTFKPGWVKRTGCIVWGKSRFDSLGGCFISQPFGQANFICRSQEARLCTKTELESDCTRGSGCGYDHDLIWSGTANAEETEDHYVVCGRGVGGNLDECAEGNSKLVPVDSLHEVRCCSDSSIAGWSEKCSGVWANSKFDGSTCFRENTFEEASDICSRYGGRLCNVAELKRSCTKGTGCGHDKNMIWSSEHERNRMRQKEADAATAGT